MQKMVSPTPWNNEDVILHYSRPDDVEHVRAPCERASWRARPCGFDVVKLPRNVGRNLDTGRFHYWRSHCQQTNQHCSLPPTRKKTSKENSQSRKASAHSSSPCAAVHPHFQRHPRHSRHAANAWVFSGTAGTSSHRRQLFVVLAQAVRLGATVTAAAYKRPQLLRSRSR
jgi:hypothetical protein